MNATDNTPANTSEQLFLAAVSTGQSGQVAEMLVRDTSLANAKDSSGTSALLLSLYHKHSEIAAQIHAAREQISVFEAAALGDVNAIRDHYQAEKSCFENISNDGFTPLHLATFFAKKSAMRYILAHGGNVEAVAKNPSRVLPIHSAAATRDASVVRIILAAGADPDSQQSGGHTALHSAVMHDNLAMTVLLLSNGADIELQNDEGFSALRLAENQRATRCIVALRRLGR